MLWIGTWTHDAGEEVVAFLDESLAPDPPSPQPSANGCARAWSGAEISTLRALFPRPLVRERLFGRTDEEIDRMAETLGLAGRN